MKTIAVVLVLIIALAADAITGMSSIVAQTTAISGCNNPQSLEQCGIGNCTFAAGFPTHCETTITFPTGFAARPSNVGATVTGWTLLGGPASLTYNDPAGTAIFEADGGTTWTGMPAAQTELYGNQRHEISIPVITGSIISAQFFVTCILGSNSNTAILRPMYADGQGGPVHELAATTGQFDIHVDETNTCVTALIGSPRVQESGIASIAAGFNAAGDPVFVFGLNGGGVGDNPIFNEIGLNIFTSKSVTPTICIALTTPCGHNSVLATSSSMIVETDIDVVEGLLNAASPPTVTFNWIAVL